MTRTRPLRVIRVAFAFDPPFVRRGLRCFIASFHDFEHAAEALAAATDIESP